MVQDFVRGLFAELEHSPEYERVRRHLAGGSGRRRVSGLTATARAVYLTLLARGMQAENNPAEAKSKPIPLLVLVADNKAAEEMQTAIEAACELTGAIAPDAVVRLPAHDVLPFENLSPHPEIQEQRAAALWRIAAEPETVRILIAPVEAAAMRLFPAEHYAALALRLRRGEEFLPAMVVEHLLYAGYDKVDAVEMPGQVGLRGGILDVYGPEMAAPVRVDFFGDEIESMREFDPVTQRTIPGAESLVEALLLPLTETPATEKILAAVHARLTGATVNANDSVAETAAEGGVGIFPGWEFFASVSGAEGTLFDLLSGGDKKKLRVMVEEPAMVQNQAERWWNKVEQRHDRSGIGQLIRPEDIYFDPWTMEDRVKKSSGCDLDPLGAVDVLSDDKSELSEVEFQTRTTMRFHGSVPALVEELQRLQRQENRIVLAAANYGEAERLAGILREYGIGYRVGTTNPHGNENAVEDPTLQAEGNLNAPVIVRAAIANGMQVLGLENSKPFVLFGVQDLVDEAEMAPRQPTRKLKTAAFLSDFRDLAVGDYIVHVEHGIARYQGLKEFEQDGQSSEFMVLEFAEQARLYVPLTRLDLIQKYRSADGGPAPELNRMGGQQWARTKSRVKKAMEDMAGELLKLYAARKATAGFAFAPDNEFQREFEDAFEFNETEDQAAAISDVKRDMESTQPMDRLLCGDVGYGKTEVAMRAAFKAVQDGKQVAVLTPTTVLAFQHYETFRKRFAQFPIHIEMISRFRTAKEQKEILERTAQGKVDILIGTHRILSKDILFQDLGLLVVDEEQRFGVRHKERLKQIRAELDVLAMSATPIPRTLHMSLAGLRDMSVIETPPKDRMAIQTIVARFDDKLVRTAIELELERSGQIFFVHNRVETIYEIASRIRELTPQARIVVAHGQMGETELERVMLAFMNYEYDVLVATTIIENGLDIPLANTILINRAERHGLSELYQLRGRVGRSNRRAYSYLLIPPEKELTDVARRRLTALKEFSDLGAGFKIAALDLELRGAGNMLGGEQSGHIEAIGFEMYTTMLEEAVRTLKGEDKAENPKTQLNLGISLRIDADYIAEENQRLRMYKRIAGAVDEAAINDIRAELTDRYGTPPATVEHLLMAGLLRLESERAGVAQLDRKRVAIAAGKDPKHGKAPTMMVDTLQLRFAQDAKIDPDELMKMVAREQKRGAQFSPQGVLRWPLTASNAESVIAEARELLGSLKMREAAG
jgi:transcription-repair coupling factor (superfamily II helicase)